MGCQLPTIRLLMMSLLLYTILDSLGKNEKILTVQMI